MPDVNVVEIIVQSPSVPQLVEVIMRGLQGPEGTIGYEGAYSSGTAYSANDIITYQGSSWVALQETTGHAPPTLPTTSNSYWSLLSAKGDPGTDGDDGNAATIEVGTVTTIASGEPATVTNVGTSAAAVFNFEIPQGPTGETGNTGETGAPGPANSLSIGTVESGADATASITGTSPSQTLNLVLPKGDTGPQGTIQSTKGDYSADTAYAEGDVVLNQGSSWVALVAGTGHAPPTLPSTANTYWQLIAQKGTDGSGDVTGPSSAANANIAVFDGTDGKTIKDGGSAISALMQADFSNATGTLSDARLPSRLATTVQTGSGAAGIADYNSAIINGWYLAAPTSANKPTGMGYAFLRVEAAANGIISQTAFDINGVSETDTKTWRRDDKSGAWGAWYRLRLSEAEQQALWDARYVKVDDAAELNWSAISTVAIGGSPSEIVFDDLDCEEIKFTIKTATPSASDALWVATSTNNGVSWQNVGALTNAGTSSLSGSLLMTGLKLGNLTGLSQVSTGSLPRSSNTTYTLSASRGAPINAIRFYWNGGAYFTSAGSIEVQTR
jgi:hypothetical protein